MEITKFDIGLLFSLSLTVVFLSMTAPMLGMASADVKQNESDMPTFEVNNDRFDIAGDFPGDPGAPSKGSITYVEKDVGLVEKRTVWLDGDTSSGTEMLLTNRSTGGGEDIYLVINQWDTGDVVGYDEYNITSEGQTVDYSNASYALQGEVTKRSNVGTENFTVKLEYTIYDQPSDSGWIQRVPIVGGIYSAGEALAQIVGWIGSILYWGLGTSIEIVLNLVGSLFDVTGYLFSTATWLITTYTDVISNAPGWAAVIVTVPGLLLFATLAKFVAVGISLLPTT